MALSRKDVCIASQEKSCLGNVTSGLPLHSTVALSHGFKDVLFTQNFCLLDQFLSAV
jgi:hypothetical protein